jgi:SAM-dependent methyltransferase
LDLSEVRSGASARHPWELARARAIRQILRGHGSFQNVLDYGCGDGFTGREVQKAFSISELVGVDIELSAAACGLQQVPEGSQELTRDESQLGSRKFELLLLCDVIEHVESDRDFMRGIAERRLKSGAHVLITVPAYQSLFSEHDRALRHYRRYSLNSLHEALRGSGFQLLESGHLFGSLLFPRLLTKARELLRRGRSNEEHGIGSWQGGPMKTRLLACALELDNDLLLASRRVGLVVPGLSLWALCKTP